MPNKKDRFIGRQTNENISDDEHTFSIQNHSIALDVIQLNAVRSEFGVDFDSLCYAIKKIKINYLM